MQHQPDPYVDFKSNQRAMWASFTPTAMFTTPVAGQLVRFADITPGERLLDTALSAFPANPLCWSFVTVAKDEAGGSYHLRRGLLSIAPALSRVESCPAPIAGRASPKSAAVAPGDRIHDGAGLAWLSDERQSLAALRTLAQDNCHFNAWMRFARAPALVDALATDIRWSPPGSRNFSTIDYAGLAQSPCPAAVPGWGYPRADLLRKAELSAH